MTADDTRSRRSRDRPMVSTLNKAQSLELSDKWRHILDVVNCTKSAEEVKLSRAYTCPIQSGAFEHRRSRFFGLYLNMRVDMLSEIEAVVDISDLENRKGTVKWKNVDSTDFEIIEAALTKLRDKIDRGKLQRGPRRMFLLAELFNTNFKKDSEGGMFGTKTYFNISSLNVDGAADLASKLNGVEWSAVPLLLGRDDKQRAIV